MPNTTFDAPVTSAFVNGSVAAQSLVQKVDQQIAAMVQMQAVVAALEPKLQMLGDLLVQIGSTLSTIEGKLPLYVHVDAGSCTVDTVNQEG